jgi:hypothetical protein
MTTWDDSGDLTAYAGTRIPTYVGSRVDNFGHSIAVCSKCWASVTRMTCDRRTYNGDVHVTPNG